MDGYKRTGSGNWKCKYCGKTFADQSGSDYKSALERHTRHHTRDNEKFDADTRRRR